MDDAPWDNEKVRQAIGMGIDRKRIADNFYPTGSEAADYFTPCAIPFGCDGDKWYAFDAKAKAKQMLTDAKLRLPQDLRLPLPDQGPELPARARPRSRPTSRPSSKDNLGINIKLVVEKDDTYLTDASKGKFPLFLLGWGADYPDMTDFLDYHFGTGANDAFGAEVRRHHDRS